MLKKIWHDPVWSKVISAGLLAGVVALFNWWSEITRASARMWSWLTSYSQAPTWLLLLLSVVSASVFLFLILLVFMGLRKVTDIDPEDWHNYRSDVFFSLRWRWHFESSGQIRELVCFCPECDFQVYPHDAGGYYPGGRVSFHCDSCGRDLGTVDQSFDSLKDKVTRFIQQKIRTGSWVTTKNTSPTT